MKYLFPIILVLLLAGCFHTKEDQGKDNCSDEIKSLINSRGAPEEIQRYDSGDYHSHTYWYWCSGYSKTFNWGEVFENCETSTYTFSPIC